MINAYCATTDPVERKTLINQYNNIFTENLYALGVFSGRYGLGIAKRYRNVPAGTPVTLYQWVEDAVMLQQVGRRSRSNEISCALGPFRFTANRRSLSNRLPGSRRYCRAIWKAIVERRRRRRLASSNLMTRTLMKQADRRIRDRARSGCARFRRPSEWAFFPFDSEA